MDPAAAPDPGRWKRMIRGWRRLSWGARVDVVVAWCLLGAARAAILTLSFDRLAPWLGVPVGARVFVPLLDAAQESRALAISRAIGSASRHTPWVSNCFAQAVVARWMLTFGGVPYSLSFGLLRPSPQAPLQAHAWVCAGRRHVTGGFGSQAFTPVGCFVAPGLVDQG